MITKENYHNQIARIDIDSLPDNIKTGHEFFLESEEFYNDDDALDLKEVMDNYLKSLNEYLQYKKSDKEPIIRDFYNRLTKVEIASLRSTGFNAQNQKLADELKISLAEVLEFDERIRPKSKKNVSKPQSIPDKPKKKEAKTTQEKTITEAANQVISLGEDVKFIKRFIGFHNKNKPIISLLNFIKALQRAIVQKIIPKTSAYADDIRKIQNRAVQFYNDHAEETEIKVVINDHDLARYVGISGGEKVYKSIGLIKRFISMQGKEMELAKVDTYLKSISKANLTDEDPYFDKVQTIVDYIQKRKKGKPVKVEEQELNGLQGIVEGCGCHHLGKIYDSGQKELRQCHSKKYSDAKKGACSHHSGVKKQKKCKELNGIMTAEEVAVQEYETLDFDGKYKALMGNPASNFDMMLFGIAGSGKTTYLLQFAHYLCTKFYKPTLYVSGEEYNSLPLTLKIRELPSLPAKLFFAKNIDTVPIPLESFSFIILDSVTDLGINLDTYKRLRDEYPEAAFIVILQTRKDGQFKGGKEWEHEMEVAGVIESGTVSIYKNRYGVKGQLNFFEDKDNNLNTI